MEYFSICSSLEDLKQDYFKFLKLYNKNEKVINEINIQYKECLEMLGIKLNENIDVENQELPKEKKKNHYNVSKDLFADVLQKIIGFNIKIEIIGQWIWCFDSFDYKEQLKELGFWFTLSKKAWVYSGSKKKAIRSHNKIDSIRKKYGSEIVKEQEEKNA